MSIVVYLLVLGVAMKRIHLSRTRREEAGCHATLDPHRRKHNAHLAVSGIGFFPLSCSSRSITILLLLLLLLLVLVLLMLVLLLPYDDALRLPP